MYILPFSQKPDGLQWATMQTHSKTRTGEYKAAYLGKPNEIKKQTHVA